MNAIRHILTLGLASLCLTDLLIASPQIPGAKQQVPIALVGATVHPVSGPPVANATLVFSEGRIVAIGAGIEIPPGAARIDAQGKHVYPGLFDAYTNLGLIEIGAVRATLDHRESGQLNPNVKAQVAVNPDSELIPVTRSNGILLALTAPAGGLIAGKSAVLQLDGWTWEEMTLRADVAMHVNWPAMAPVSDWWIERSAKEQAESRDQALEKLTQLMADARAYQAARAAREAEGDQLAADLRLQAVIPVLDGSLPLVIAADNVQQIQAAVAFGARERIKLIIYGGYDAERCAALLKQHEIPVIVAGVYRLPQRRGDEYDAAYTLPERLRRSGVRYCISASGRFGASNVRNLPYHAATAAAFGLPADEALKAITLYPAQILGVADRVGSLEPGKDATLFVSDGDPLVTQTQVEMAFIQGRPVDLSDRHKLLWKKYQQKYSRPPAQ